MHTEPAHLNDTPNDALQPVLQEIERLRHVFTTTPLERIPLLELRNALSAHARLEQIAGGPCPAQVPLMVVRARIEVQRRLTPANDERTVLLRTVG